MLWQALLWWPLLFTDRKTRSKILISLKSHTKSGKITGSSQLFHTSHFKHFYLLNLTSVSVRPQFLKISDFFSDQSQRSHVDFTMKAFSIFSRLSRTTIVLNGTCHFIQKPHHNRAKQNLQVKKRIHTLFKREANGRNK